MWGNHVPLGTPADVAALLGGAGVAGAAELAERMDQPDLVAELDAANAAAAERGVFGSPTFFVGDEMFFGNDRLDFLREALETAQ